jgi:hypothetical protein
VREQIANRDPLLAVLAELGDERRNRIGQPDAPCSTSIITAGVVATTFVSDARSKIVSSVIASRDGTTARSPYALRQTTVSPRPTTTTRQEFVVGNRVGDDTIDALETWIESGAGAAPRC